MTEARIERGEVGTLTELASGGEGVVYAIAERPDLVYKEYTGATGSWKPNEAGFNALRRALDAMPAADRALVLDRTAWPQTAVFDSGSFVGILMRRIPADYVCEKTFGKRTMTSVRDCNFLIFPDYLEKPAVKYDFRKPSRENLVEIVRQYVDTVCLLHRHDIVIGDVSGANAAWREHAPGVILVDCDSFSTTTTRPISPEKETPDWEDPLPHVGTNHLTDSYKMGLMVFRMLTGGETNRPAETDFAHLDASFPELPGVGDVVRRSVASSVAAARPCAAEWLAAVGLAVPPIGPTGAGAIATGATTMWRDGDVWFESRDGKTVRLLRVPALTLPLIPCTVNGRACWRPDPSDPGLRGARITAPAKVVASSTPSVAPERKFRPLT